MRSRNGSCRDRWNRLPLLLGAVALAPGAGGCATVAIQAAYLQDDDLDDLPCGSIYGGTAWDLSLVTGGYCSCSGVRPGPVDGALDLPLSLAADTAFLPLTIAETIPMALRRRDAGERAGAAEVPRRDLEELRELAARREQVEREMEALRRAKEDADAE